MSHFDQDIAQRSAGRHGSTGSRPDVSAAQYSPFQESATSVNCTFPAFPNDLDEHGMINVWDFYPSEIGTSVDVNVEKPEDNDQKPQLGMLFPSLIEAEEFYRNHANKTGFTVRKGKIQKLADGALKWRRFLCSCQGHRVKKQSNEGTKYQRLDTRTGCQAHIQFTLENGQYMITHLELMHNHSLKNSNGSPDKSIKEALSGPSEKVEGASVNDKVCSKHPLKQIGPQALESTRANGEASLAPDEAENNDKDLSDAIRILGNINRLLKGNHKEQLLEGVTKLDSMLQLHTKNPSSFLQQTQGDSLSSYSEESMASDEVETACNYVQNASDQLAMEERSLPVANRSDEKFGVNYLPAQVPPMTDVNHWLGVGTAVSMVASSTVQIPTLPIITIASARSTPAAAAAAGGGGGGSSSPSLPSCLQEMSHSSESIWQQILTKYGDITAKCTLTSPVFVSFVKQSVLQIVEQLQNNTARGLSREKLSTIGRMLGDLELVQVEVGWLRTRYVAVEHLIDYAEAKENRDVILRRLHSKRAEVAELQVELDRAEVSLQELQHRIPEWLTVEDTLGKGLL